MESVLWLFGCHLHLSCDLHMVTMATTKRNILYAQNENSHQHPSSISFPSISSLPRYLAYISTHTWAERSRGRSGAQVWTWCRTKRPPDLARSSPSCSTCSLHIMTYTRRESMREYRTASCPYPAKKLTELSHVMEQSVVFFAPVQRGGREPPKSNLEASLWSNIGRHLRARTSAG